MEGEKKGKDGDGAIGKDCAAIVVEVEGIQVISADPCAAVAGSKSLIYQYADDTTITVEDEESLRCVKEVVNKYCEATGAKVNYVKSEVMKVGGGGEWDGGELPFTVAMGMVKVLGVYVGVDARAVGKRIWTEVIGDEEKVTVVGI
ncbi:hypothetical protein AAFF_G00179620 [Aldrovandia affinis]|uniref:Reverse transcriptase domain-containing protein n=1 Tax=Aldrovandia affinis TaxID=143900 RepID=A0AAD7RN61_9TELE|nr:hypothetical protein AAFF_G00179620 [Aldrovandia affinis]